ncbi:MAG: hypothetical protein U0X87_13685 [Anaerolineales bacterium]
MKPKHWLVFITLGAIWSSSFLWIKIGVQDVVLCRVNRFPHVVRRDHCRCDWRVSKSTMLPRDLRTWLIFVVLGLRQSRHSLFSSSRGANRRLTQLSQSILNATTPLFTVVIAHFMLQDDKMTVQKALGLLDWFCGNSCAPEQGSHGGCAEFCHWAGGGNPCLIFYAVSAVFGRKFTQHVEGTARRNVLDHPGVDLHVDRWVRFQGMDHSNFHP